MYVLKFTIVCCIVYIYIICVSSMSSIWRIGILFLHGVQRTIMGRFTDTLVYIYIYTITIYYNLICIMYIILITDKYLRISNSIFFSEMSRRRRGRKSRKWADRFKMSAGHRFSVHNSSWRPPGPRKRESDTDTLRSCHHHQPVSRLKMGVFTVFLFLCSGTSAQSKQKGKLIMILLMYRPFHNSLRKANVHVHLFSIRNYEIGVITFRFYF